MKLAITMTMGLEEALLFRESLRPLYSMSVAELSNTDRYRKEIFRELWEQLRDGLPNLNTPIIHPIAFYGSAGR